MGAYREEQVQGSVERGEVSRTPSPIWLDWMYREPSPAQVAMPPANESGAPAARESTERKPNPARQSAEPPRPPEMQLAS
jgi:hypothetical protein